MSRYPNTENERRIGFEDLRALGQTIFERCGMSAADAELLSDTLAVADLRGVHSHGVIRIPDYVHKLTEGGVDPRGVPLVVRRHGATAVIDGGNSMGQIGSAAAVRLGIEIAQSLGLAFVAIRGSNHCGALQYFTRMALAHDMIGLMGTNALPTMAPWGGVEKVVGMNPLSIAIPAGSESPIVFDAAFANTAHGKIRVYAQKGVAIPADWAFDAEGRATTDPLQALMGLLQPAGGHKGIAMAMGVGVLSSLLSGAAYGTQSGNMHDGPVPGVDGHFVMLIQIAAFLEPAAFKARTDELVREIHASRRAPGVERLFVPGEIEDETERRYRALGIPLNDATWADLRQIAARLALGGRELECIAA